MTLCASVYNTWGQTFLLWMYLWLFFLCSFLSLLDLQAIFSWTSTSLSIFQIFVTPLPSPDGNNSTWEGQEGQEKERMSMGRCRRCL